MKGILLAGGNGTRLYPITKSISKQIMPVYDKPMIYYPLSILMNSGIKDILIITTERDLNIFKNLLKDGHQLGINIEYMVQKKPNGIAEAFILGEKFISGDSVCLILGDNIFYSKNLENMLTRIVKNNKGATIFGYKVNNPREYGVANFKGNKVVSIEEKPKNPKSNFAIPGLYFYDKDVVEISKRIKPSDRGELEITSVNNEYLKKDKLYIELLDESFLWFDTGNYDMLLKAANFVSSYQRENNEYIACIEEIAFKKCFINKDQLKKSFDELSKTAYGKYIKRILES